MQKYNLLNEAVCFIRICTREIFEKIPPTPNIGFCQKTKKIEKTNFPLHSFAREVDAAAHVDLLSGVRTRVAYGLVHRAMCLNYIRD